MKFYTNYIESLDDKSTHTIRAYKNSIEKFFNALKIQNVEDMKNVESSDVRSYLNNMAKNVSAGTVNAHFRNLKAFFNWLVAEEILDKAPLNNVKARKEEKKIAVALTEDERNAMIQASPNDNIRLMLLFMFFLGLRREEVTNVKVKDIDRSKRLLIHGKGMKERSLQIPDEIYDFYNRHLLNRPHSSEYVFISQRGSHQITGDAVGKRVKKVAELAGIDSKRAEEISAHTTRRTFACLLTENDVSAFTVQKLLGHSSITTTQRYVAGASTKGMDDAVVKQNMPKGLF